MRKLNAFYGDGLVWMVSVLLKIAMKMIGLVVEAIVKLAIGKDLKVGPYEMVVKAKANTFERIEAFSFYVNQKPKVEYVEIKPEFSKVLAEAGIVLPEEGVTEDNIFQCPDLSKIVVGGKGFPPEEESPREDSNWLMISAIVLIVNVLFAGAGFFGFKFYKKKEAEADASLMNKLAN